MKITGSTLQAIHDDGFQFAQLFAWYVEQAFAVAALKPKISVQRLYEAHGAWKNDLDRVGKHEKKLTDGLDHFKQAGHLAFWIRRFCPIIEASCALNGDTPTAEQQAEREFLYSYSNEYIAFVLGYNICRFYEIFRTDVNDYPRAKELKLTRGYVEMACHFLKYKTASPHALTMAYKSMFFNGR